MESTQTEDNRVETTTDDGGPAFPLNLPDDRVYLKGHGYGMSLRDWFAGQAMQGLIVSPSTAEQCYASDEKTAAWAYAVADAMLEARAAK